jgi:hypothetical protein
VVNNSVKEFVKHEKWNGKIWMFLMKQTHKKFIKKQKKLSENAVTISNELAKFDSYVGQKTKTFMHLVNAAKQLSKEYMDLKEEIRKLHIKKQRYDTETLKES